MPRDLENLRAWKQANRERLNAQQRDYAARHPARVKASHVKYYQANAEAIKAKARARRQEDPETARAYGREYYWRYPEEEREKVKRSYRKHRNTILARLRANKKPPTEKDREKGRINSKRQRVKHPDRVRARIAAWAKAHPERRALKEQKRRAKKNSAPRNDVTHEQHQAVIAAAHGVCPYCPIYKPGCQACKKGTHKLTLDHITPLYNGGSHTLHNLIACCRSCNSAKRTGKAPVLVQPLLL